MKSVIFVCIFAVASVRASPLVQQTLEESFQDCRAKCDKQRAIVNVCLGVHQSLPVLNWPSMRYVSMCACHDPALAVLEKTQAEQICLSFHSRSSCRHHRVSSCRVIDETKYGGASKDDGRQFGVYSAEFCSADELHQARFIVDRSDNAYSEGEFRAGVSNEECRSIRSQYTSNTCQQELPEYFLREPVVSAKYACGFNQTSLQLPATHISQFETSVPQECEYHFKPWVILDVLFFMSCIWIPMGFFLFFVQLALWIFRRFLNQPLPPPTKS